MDSHRSTTWVQVLWAVAGLVLLGGAFLALFAGGDDVTVIAVPLGLAMLFAGASNTLIYHKKRSVLHGAHWLLADGLSTALLSIFPLFNRMVMPGIIPFFFGVWELFSGILKAIDAHELREDGIRGSHWFAGIGIAEILSGIAALLKPVDVFVGMHRVVAIVFFVQSCGFISKALLYPRLVKGEAALDS